MHNHAVGNQGTLQVGNTLGSGIGGSAIGTHVVGSGNHPPRTQSSNIGGQAQGSGSHHIGGQA